MAIEQSMNLDWVYFNPVEWTGTMPVMNWATSGAEIELGCFATSAPETTTTTSDWSLPRGGRGQDPT